MKKTLLLFLLFISSTIFSQQFNSKWEKVVAFENEGKTKSAFEIVEAIYKKAKSNNNEEQLIKCFFYKSKYLQTFDEKAHQKIITNLKTEIESVSKPSKAILNLIYADILTAYFNDAKNKIYNRTQLETINEDDFSTWTQNDFLSQIEKRYAKTLVDESDLKAIPISKYESIFDYYQPIDSDKISLLDFLIQKNIDYKVSQINKWELNRDDFKTVEAQLLGSNAEFLKVNLDSIKNEKCKSILKLYQKVESLKVDSKTELNRMFFCQNYIIKSDSFFLKTLNNFKKQSTDTLTNQRILFEKASLLEKLANKTEHPTYFNDALKTLDSIENYKNRSNIYKLSQIKKQSIKNSELSIQLQQYSYEHENTRVFVTYKNVNSLKISFYKIKNKTIKTITTDSLAKQFTVLNQVFKSQTYPIINKKDNFNYTTELSLPQLELGNYLVLFESENDENSKKGYTFKTITVSNLSVLANQNNDTTFFQVLNRKTGHPIENCKVLFLDKKGITNSEGIAKFKYIASFNEYPKYIFIKDNDSLRVDNTYINNNYYNSNTKNDRIDAKVELYLDRGIYRPGQKVYYKGIVIQKQNSETKVIPNLNLTMTIENADDEDFKKIEVMTTEFGSFNGEFDLPKNGLTGNYNITVEEPEDVTKDVYYNQKKDENSFWDNVEFQEGRVSFKVEEYKRPKFEVTFSPINETFTMNNKIIVKGNAKAFAGSPISDAGVKYSIHRDASSTNKYKNDDLIVKEIKTDAFGNFIIEFDALPFDEFKKKDLPIYNFRIKADITDINGETHSAETNIRVGYQSLELKMTLPKSLQSNKPNEIILSSTNLNRQFVGCQGEIKIFYLKPFEHKFKTRFFNTPEIETITKSDFEKLYPFEPNSLTDINSIVGELVFTKQVNTSISKLLNTDFTKDLKSGHYKIVYTTIDAFSNKISTEGTFELQQILDKNKTRNELFTIEQVNEDAKKDGFIVLKINTAVPNLNYNLKGIYRSNCFYDKSISQNELEQIIKIPIEKSFEKGIKFGIETIFENQYFTIQKEFELKNILPKINFEVETFRFKIEPGKLEKWSFKLNENNQPISAEILGSMYDSSLDNFSKTSWNRLRFQENNGNYFSPKSALGFEKTYASFSNLNSKLPKFIFYNENLNLMKFGFDFNDPNSLSAKNLYDTQTTNKIKKPLNALFISGVVSDNLGVLPGVNVQILGSTRRTSSDFDGFYEIEAAPGEILVFSFVEMQNVQKTVGASLIINATLKSVTGVLNEVIVGAMGMSKKMSATTSYQVVTETGNVELIRSLSGKVSGLQIKNVSEGVNSNTRIILRGNRSISGNNYALVVIDGAISSTEILSQLPPELILNVDVLKGTQATALYGEQGANGVIVITTKKGLQEVTQVKTRTNLSETAFFYPNLKTDKDGKFNFDFTSPEALTQWKLRLLAHTKKGISSYLEKNVVTQKELMVFPNMPRFLREKDTIIITAKISNLTSEVKNGIAILQLFDASTMQSVDTKMLNEKNIRNFGIKASGNETVSWKITIPEGLQGLQYKVIAKAGNFSDGEENILPVLTNSMLVTESIPIWVRENSKKEYSFENLKNNNSTTLKNHQFTLEYTSNPTWLALKSLPYLIEYEHECAEQTFARFYGNVLATEIVNSNPKIASLFETWKKSGNLTSKLNQNEELKSVLLAETPWLLDAQNEEEKQKNLAILFDLDKMKTSTEATFKKLKDKQKPSGGFGWFDGGNESDYITNHIVSGLAHLQKLKVKLDENSDFSEIIKTAIPFLDKSFLSRNESGINKSFFRSYEDLDYLYMRSFYVDSFPLNENLKKQMNVKLQLIGQKWLDYSVFEKGLAALICYRFNDKTTAEKIIESLKQTASNNEDWGMYWIENKSGWNWYEAPIETQALLIEAFSEIKNDNKSVDLMKVWLLKQKQTKNWPTTKSTTEAIYALLLQGSDWTSIKDDTKIKIGNQKIITSKLKESEKEAETGYIKMNWKSNEISKEMATISVENNSKVPAFGGVYWQYFEDLDKINSNNKNILSVSKELFLKKNTTDGMKLEKITSKKPLLIGDLVTVRLTIETKEDMEYVHLKDMRAACFDPISVLSQYKWQAGLGFYQSTKDVATHFFFDNINKGTYVIEYDIRVNNKGEFSNGITTIESMYAPEFSSHTKGIRVKVLE